MGHSLRTKRFAGALLLTLSLPCSRDAFDAFVKEAKKEKNEKGETIVNHEAQIALVFSRGNVDLIKADGAKMVVYQDAYIGAHDVFGLPVPVQNFDDDLTQDAAALGMAVPDEEWSDPVSGSDAVEGSTKGKTA